MGAQEPARADGLAPGKYSSASREKRFTMRSNRTLAHCGLSLMLVAGLLAAAPRSPKGAAASPLKQKGKAAPSATTPPVAAPRTRATCRALQRGAADDREKKLPEPRPLRRARSGLPENSGTLTNLGIIYAKSNRLSQAVAALDKATDSTTGIGGMELAGIANVNRRPHKAERAYLKSISRSQTMRFRISTWYSLRHVPLAPGRCAGAI